MASLRYLFTKSADATASQIAKQQEAVDRRNRILNDAIDEHCIDFLSMVDEIVSAVNHRLKTKELRFDYLMSNNEFKIWVSLQDKTKLYDVRRPGFGGAEKDHLEFWVYFTKNENKPEFLTYWFDTKNRLSTEDIKYVKSRELFKRSNNSGKFYESFALWAGKCLGEYSDVIAPILEKHQYQYEPYEPPAPVKKRFGLF